MFFIHSKREGDWPLDQEHRLAYTSPKAHQFVVPQLNLQPNEHKAGHSREKLPQWFRTRFRSTHKQLTFGNVKILAAKGCN